MKMRVIDNTNSVMTMKFCSHLYSSINGSKMSNNRHLDVIHFARVVRMRMMDKLQVIFEDDIF